MKQIEVSHYKVFLPGLECRLRIVALSDLHPRTLSIRISDLVDLINVQDADVVVLAGGIIDGCPLEELSAQFVRIRASVGKLAVMGNHEYYCKKSNGGVEQFYRQSGFRLLVNTRTKVGGVFWVGLDDYRYGSPDANLLQDTDDESMSSIWISHSPIPFDAVANQYSHPTLMIAGHTHGGQIAPFGKALFTPFGSGRYKNGWYKIGQHSLYAMRGIGTSNLFPFRLGAKPEILVIDAI